MRRLNSYRQQSIIDATVDSNARDNAYTRVDSGGLQKAGCSYEAGGDIIIGNIGSASSIAAVDKNLRQSSSIGKKAPNNKQVESGTKTLYTGLRHIFTFSK